MELSFNFQTDNTFIYIKLNKSNFLKFPGAPPCTARLSTREHESKLPFQIVTQSRNVHRDIGCPINEGKYLKLTYLKKSLV